MAKIQGYFENNKPGHYDEGPWILCQMPAGHYRIERHNLAAPCATFPTDPADEYSLKLVMRAAGLEAPVGSFERLAPIVDLLNETFRHRLRIAQ